MVRHLPRISLLNCPGEQTVYYSPRGFAAHTIRFGDYAPIAVIAHEWGHHVQTLLGINPAPGSAFELQADCLSGAFANEAGQQGLLEPGDITEAVITSADAGDPVDAPQDVIGAHDINDERVSAFMRGYLDGISGFNLPLAVIDLPDIENQQPEQIPLLSLVPLDLVLPQGQRFKSEQGTSSFADMLTSFDDDNEAAALLRQTGWQENVYRIYEAETAPSGAVNWLTMGLHRFARLMERRQPCRTLQRPDAMRSGSSRSMSGSLPTRRRP